MSLSFTVTDLLGRPGAHREVRGAFDVDLWVGTLQVAGPVDVDVGLEAVFGGLMVRGTAVTTATVACNRCLTEWQEPIEAEVLHHLSERPDEDGYRIDPSGIIDLEPIMRDAVATALPLAPICRPDCAGLCPVCGTDLNIAPCGGHGEPKRSPFAALEHLFDRP